MGFDELSPNGIRLPGQRSGQEANNPVCPEPAAGRCPGTGFDELSPNGIGLPD